MIGYEDIAEGLDNADKQAVLVEEVGSGEFRRYALTPEEFKEKFGQCQVVGFSSDGWEAFSVESADFWCRCGVVGDDVWEKFFSDMTYGLSPNDISDGFRACVRGDLFGELKTYLPENEQSLEEKIQAAEGQREGLVGNGKDKDFGREPEL